MPKPKPCIQANLHSKNRSWNCSASLENNKETPVENAQLDFVRLLPQGGLAQSLTNQDEESATPGAGPGITASVVSPASSASFGELWCGAAPRGSHQAEGENQRHTAYCLTG